MQCFISVQSPLSSSSYFCQQRHLEAWLSAQLLCADQGQGQSSGSPRTRSGFLSVGQRLVWCITTCMQGAVWSCGHSATLFGPCPGFFLLKNFVCTVYYVMFMCYDCLQGCELKLNEFLSKSCCENKCNSSSLLSSPRSSSLHPPCV